LAYTSKSAGDVEGALQYAYDRLLHGLDARYKYHNEYHTFKDVMPAALYLADVYGLPDEERDALRIGVAFHDIGFIEGPLNHERRGIELAAQVLPEFHVSPATIKVVAGLILATRMPQSPTNLLEEIIADADLDVLGREDFPIRNALLYQEGLLSGSALGPGEWLQYQVRFLSDHRYFTQAARDHRDAGKRRNLTALVEQVG
jgi:uncharacterized protein